MLKGSGMGGTNMCQMKCVKCSFEHRINVKKSRLVWFPKKNSQRSYNLWKFLEKLFTKGFGFGEN